MRDDSRMLSRPALVRWMGWETNTVYLQRTGWEIAIDFSHSDFTYRMMLRNNQMEMYGISHDSDFMGNRPDRQHEQPMPEFNIHHMGKSPQIVIQEGGGYRQFQQIDAEPTFVNTEIKSIEDFNIFSVCQHKTEEVLIEGADWGVIEHLEAIKELQKDKQAELRKKSRKKEGSSERIKPTEMVAQIVRVA